MIKNQILELQNNQPLKVEFIKTWLAENENYFYFLINEASCNVWRNWSKDKSKRVISYIHCSNRTENCKAIEVYYNLYRIIQAYNKQILVKDVLAEYKQIKNNHDAVYNWVEKYFGINDFLGLEISTEIKNELGQNITFVLDKIEFETALKFDEVVLDIYCSEEYQIRFELNKTKKTKS